MHADHAEAELENWDFHLNTHTHTFIKAITILLWIDLCELLPCLLVMSVLQYAAVSLSDYGFKS